MPWASSLPKELSNESIVYIEANETVESACEKLVSSDAAFLAVLDDLSDTSTCLGLFDYADVNTFLLLAIGSHLPTPDEPRAFHKIVEYARVGTDILVLDACNLSEKNALTFLEDGATIESVLRIFSKGNHRVMLRDGSEKITGVISDRYLVDWFARQASSYPELESVLALPLQQLDIGISKRVISLSSEASVLDAMKLMHEQGVSSIAVLDGEGTLLSAVSVTDVGRLVATSPDRSVLSKPLSQFISLIKLPQGSTDGEDRYPVFSITRQATLERAIQLVLATNSHRLFISSAFSNPGSNIMASPSASPALLPTPPPTIRSSSSLRLPPSPNDLSTSPASSTSPSTTLSSPPTTKSAAPYGVISVIDILGVFARLAGVQDVDPNTVRKHRRGSSTALSNGGSGFITGSAGGGSGSHSGTPSPTMTRLRGWSTSSDPKNVV